MSSAIGYVRISTKNQKDGISIDDQIERIEVYCSLKGLTLVHIYREKPKSGESIEGRPEFKSALSRLNNSDVDGLIVHDLARLTRNTRDMLMLKDDYFQKNTLHSLTESVDTRTSGGVMYMTVLSAINQQQREKISERTREVMDYKRSKGEFLGGSIPLGYKVEGKLLVECEEEAKLIKRVKNMKYKKLSFQKIANRLNELGIVNKRSSKGTWTKQAIMRLIKA